MAAAFACGGDSGDSNGDNNAQSTATTPPSVVGTVLPGINLTQIPSQVLTQIPSQVQTVIPQVTIQTGSGSGTSACALVTREEAAAALGEQVGTPNTLTVNAPQQIIPGVNITLESCQYFSMTSGRSIEVTIWKSVGGTAQQIRQAVEQFLCMGKERVSGVGDVACWFDASRTELQALKGGTLVIFRMDAGAGVNTVQVLSSVASRGLGRVQ
jgi:hypothetical protein